MIFAALVTWALLVKTEPGLAVGPIALHESFAQVEETLGPAQVTKSDCDSSAAPSCFPALTYTDGSSTVTITGESLFPWPQKVDLRAQDVEMIQIVRGAKQAAKISAPGVRPIDAWSWKSARVFSQPPPAIAGWERSKASTGEVFFNKTICEFTEGDGPEGQLVLQGYWWTFAGQRAFTLHYNGFGERCS